jgi:hypothetical protein
MCERRGALFVSARKVAGKAASRAASPRARRPVVTLAAIGHEAATLLGRRRPFSRSYVLRVLDGSKGMLGGSSARAILEVARTRGRK